MQTEYRDDPNPENDALNALWASAWNDPSLRDFSPILARSLAHVGAFAGPRLIGFVNVAWDGGIHAFIPIPVSIPNSEGRVSRPAWSKGQQSSRDNAARSGCMSISSSILPAFIESSASPPRKPA